MDTKFDKNLIPYILSDTLYENFDYIPFNKGKSYGILRLTQQSQYDISDIAFFRTIPNTLSHISGIITEIPQTPLSHINLIARQNNIPNAYIRDPLKIKSIQDLDNMYVHFIVKDEGFILEEATDDQFQLIWDSYSVPTSLRCRSSTNSEDLQGFSGAGLYESCTHKSSEGKLSKSIKQVWAGAWTYRAYQEREFYRIDHLKASMAVLIHPNYKKELSNGVAVTKNIYDINYRGFYVNVQIEEDMITNPDAESIPEEFLISVKGLGDRYEVEYIRYSNRVPDGYKIVSPAHIKELTGYMEFIQNHFISKYNAIHDDSFAMEIEFKVTSSGILAIKQARPW